MPDRRSTESDEALAPLFSTPPSRFVAVRDELAAEAKKKGRADLAIRIKGMKRPSPVVWLANALAREHPDDVADVLAAGAALREAYASGEVDAVRDATQRRHRAVAAALRHAHALAAKAGLGSTAERPLAATLIGASLDPAQAKVLSEGRLRQEVVPPALESALREAPSERAPKPPPSRGRGDSGQSAAGGARAAKKAAMELERELGSRRQAAEAANRELARREKLAAAARELAASAAEAAERAEIKVTEARKIAAEREAAVRSLRSR